MVRLWVLILVRERQVPLANLQKGWVGFTYNCICRKSTHRFHPNESYVMRFYFADRSRVHVCKCVCFVSDRKWPYSCLLVKVHKCDLPRLGPVMHELHWHVFHLHCGGQVLRGLPCSEQTCCQEENWVFSNQVFEESWGSKESKQRKMYHTIAVHVYTVVFLKINPRVWNM
jgi:hypothetical protein